MSRIDNNKSQLQQQHSTSKIAWESFDANKSNTNTINLGHGGQQLLKKALTVVPVSFFVRILSSRCIPSINFKCFLKDEKPTSQATSNKIAIPYLDLSYLSENQNNMNKGNVKFVDEGGSNKSDEHGNKKG